MIDPHPSHDPACIGEDRADPDSWDDPDIAEAWQDPPEVEPAPDAPQDGGA